MAGWFGNVWKGCRRWVKGLHLGVRRCEILFERTIASRLDRQVLRESITNGCYISFGSAGVEREYHTWVPYLICIDRCRVKATIVVSYPPINGAL